MNDYGEVIGAGTVRFRRLLPGPIERVWEYLTDSKLRGTWFASGPMEPREGGSLTLHFRHQDLTEHNEPIPEKHKAMENGITSVSRVTHWEPPRHLAYTWDANSVVHFELEPKGKDVLLTLTHRHLASRTDMIDVSGGWHSHLDVLAERLRGESPAPFWPRVERYEREYPGRIP
jgi:uncharacterized protein YndB with AHSA1/START domain